MKQPKFLKQLEDAKLDTQSEAGSHGNEVFQKDWWDAPKGAASPEAESDEGYLEVHLPVNLHTPLFLPGLCPADVVLVFMDKSFHRA